MASPLNLILNTVSRVSANGKHFHVESLRRLQVTELLKCISYCHTSNVEQTLYVCCLNASLVFRLLVVKSDFIKIISDPRLD